MDETTATYTELFPSSDGDSCEHCSAKAVTRENGTPLCEDHYNEYLVKYT